jgi:probable HAF family extracellular repeat protein
MFTFGRRLRVGLMMLSVLAVGFAIPLGVASGGKTVPPPVKYTMTLLPLLDGTTTWTARNMNSFGDVLGTSAAGPVLCTRTGHVVLLSTLIPFPPNVYRFQTAYDINDDLQIVGWVYVYDTDGQLRYHAYRCTVMLDAGGNPVGATDYIDLGAPPGFTWSYGYAINRFGDVACRAEDDGVHIYSGYLWTELGGWVEIPGTGRALDVNDACQVVGSIAVGGQNHAARYTPSVGVEDLGVLVAGSWSNAYAINASGQVAGNAISSVGSEHAFRYTDGQGMKDLGALYSGRTGGSWVSGQAGNRAINSQGHVVGTSSQYAGQRPTRPFLYTDPTGMVDLSTLISNLPAGLDLNTLVPEAINDYAGHAFGQISANAVISGTSRPFLLTPDR